MMRIACHGKKNWVEKSKTQKSLYVVQGLFFNRLRSNHSFRLPTLFRATTDCGSDRESLNKITSGVRGCSTSTSIRSSGIVAFTPLRREKILTFISKAYPHYSPPFFSQFSLFLIPPPPSICFLIPQEDPLFFLLLNCPRFSSPFSSGVGSIQYLNLCTNP